MSEDTFFKSVISYPNALFRDFDYTNVNEVEKNLMENIFEFITNIRKKIENENSFSLAMTYFLKVYSFKLCGKIGIISGILSKISLILLEKFYDKPKLKKEKDNEMEIAIKEFNKNNMNKGYFLACK